MRSSDWSSDVCASDLFRHRNSERVEAAGVGRIAAGHAAPAETAGTHLAAHVALASAVRHALPRPTGALRRAGPAVPGLREPPPRLSGRHAGTRPGDRRLCAETAAVIPAACGRPTGATGGPGRSLDRRQIGRAAGGE